MKLFIVRHESLRLSLDEQIFRTCIDTKLNEIMLEVNLDNVTSKDVSEHDFFVQCIHVSDACSSYLVIRTITNSTANVTCDA
jgi:hypothetical protein